MVNLICKRIGKGTSKQYVFTVKRPKRVTTKSGVEKQRLNTGIHKKEKKRKIVVNKKRIVRDFKLPHLFSNNLFMEKFSIAKYISKNPFKFGTYAFDSFQICQENPKSTKAQLLGKTLRVTEFELLLKNKILVLNE